MTTSSTTPTPTDVFAILRRDGDQWMGRLLAPRDGSAPRFAFPRGRGPAHVPLGTVLVAGLLSRRQGRLAQCRAKLVSVEMHERGCAIEVEPDDPTLWSEVVPGTAARQGDRRKWPRLAPRAAAEVLVPVEVEVGPASGRQFAALLVDASHGGAGLRFPAQAEPRLSQAAELHCGFQTDDGATEVRRCQVRHRSLRPLGVRYGVAFVGVLEDGGRRAEPTWSCPRCGQEGLLAASHAHCPACGSASEAPIPRDGSSPEADVTGHLFRGVDRTCLRCGAAWSSAARNCGHCGTRLPQVRF